MSFTISALLFLGVDNPHGAAWRSLLANFESELEISAIVPGFDDGTTSLEERYARLPRFDTVDDLIGDGDFDGAFVALPNSEGPQAATKLAAAGKHVLVEKPIAGCAQDAKPLADAVTKSNVAFQCGYMWALRTKPRTGCARWLRTDDLEN